MNTFLRLHQFTLRFDPLLDRWGFSLFALALRSFVAWQFFKAGLVKIQDWDSTLSLFREEYMVPILPPEIAAYAGASGELVLPIFLLFGLFSRPAALGLFALNVMAVVSYPQLWQFECPAAINDHFYWGILLLGLVVKGSGDLSIDRVLMRQTSSKTRMSADSEN